MRRGKTLIKGHDKMGMKKRKAPASSAQKDGDWKTTRPNSKAETKKDANWKDVRQKRTARTATTRPYRDERSSFGLRRRWKTGPGKKTANDAALRGIFFDQTPNALTPSVDENNDDILFFIIFVVFYFIFYGVLIRREEEKKLLFRPLSSTYPIFLLFPVIVRQRCQLYWLPSWRLTFTPRTTQSHKKKQAVQFDWNFTRVSPPTYTQMNHRKTMESRAFHWEFYREFWFPIGCLVARMITTRHS